VGVICLCLLPFYAVIAREGGQSSNHRAVCIYWVPACAGTTGGVYAMLAVRHAASA
jgi:hypothetical protein